MCPHTRQRATSVNYPPNYKCSEAQSVALVTYGGALLRQEGEQLLAPELLAIGDGRSGLGVRMFASDEAGMTRSGLMVRMRRETEHLLVLLQVRYISWKCVG